MNTASQIAQTKKRCIDMETPDSILVNMNLKALINNNTFGSLPPLYQYHLTQLLPSVDLVIDSDYSTRLCTSTFSNEFFARACQDWQERLAEGEFTPENQQRMKTELEKENGKLDPWKLKYFEPVWGKKSTADISDEERTSSFFVDNLSLNSSLITHNRCPLTIKIEPIIQRNHFKPAIVRQTCPAVTFSNALTSPLQAVDMSTLRVMEVRI
ncbi:polycomb protein Asx-like [Limulus polyphemus]|uniref:Polycomb protein Asx-like n=1 Tax=Limulus polyphemus TaxID=6850 RepID=A0ABM1T1B0_LIMPO|nr:polycomb protein Asx-like [Limulus polyphemus]